jgi:hypothetical protein
MKSGEPADNRCIVRISPIAMNFGEVFEEPLDEIQGVRTVGVASKLDPFKCSCAGLFLVVWH